MRRAVYMTLAFLTLAAAAASAEPVVRLSVTPAELPFHQRAILTIEVDAPIDAKVTFPKVAGVDGIYEVAQGTFTSDAIDEDTRRSRQTYLVDPIAINDYLFSGFSVQVGETSLPVPPIALRVRDLTDAELRVIETFADIRLPGHQLATPPQQVTRWLIAAAVLVLVALAAWLLWRRAHRVAPLPPAPAWVVAQQRLSGLAARNLPATGQHELFYVDLSAILRYYIEDRFHLHAPEQTTNEFLDASARSGLLSEVQQQALAGFLRQSDRVKFARYTPTREQMEESFVLVARFVEETIPNDEAAPPQEQAA